MTLPMRLGHVALRLEDPGSLQALLNNALGLRVGQVRTPSGTYPILGVGEVQLVLLARGDDKPGRPTPAGLDHLGLVTEQPGDLATATGLAAEDSPDSALTTDEVRLARDPTTGLLLRAGAPLEPDWEPSNDDVLVERLDHIGVASADNRAGESLLSERLGFPVESRQTDMEVRTQVESFTSDRYGVVYHAREPEPVGGLRVSFVTVGECELEFLEEVDPAGMSASREQALGHRPGTTRQDQGAIGRFIARRGAGLHHLALKTADIDQALTRLAGAGAQVIDQVGRPGSRRARIGFVHPRSTGGVLMHLVERTPL